MAIRCNAQENMFKPSYLLLPNNVSVGCLEARAPMPHTWRRHSMIICYGDKNTRAASISKAGLTVVYDCAVEVNWNIDKDLTAFRKL
jgi:hypothetical protein